MSGGDRQTGTSGGRNAGRGDRIGPFHLLDVLGEGGFGVVYLAEQREPVRRRVALKVIKPGMGSKEVLARFDAERQALALMDHPNVAKIFDAGISDGERPYFAMEHVPGVPIVEFCDQHRLPTRERIALFVSVCNAVQHAHQKGIIHRDLKPSNILVMLIDGRPVPKVIDFGIAKATTYRLSEDTLFTEAGAMIGTPEYMSPEQAGTSGLDVDTRTDVYSLGVLLYELLCGSLPFDRNQLRQAGFLEIVRVIKEDEPPRPSTRLINADTATAARNRSADPRALVRELRGDLDWIAGKAMEKDRTRRYETANALAMDLGRYLSHEAVLARPPSTAYRLSRFVRKHRTGFVAGSVAVTALVAGAIAVSWSLIEAVSLGEQLTVAKREAEEQRDAASRQAEEARAARTRAEAITAFMTDMLGLADPDVSKDPNVTARQLLDRAAAEVGRVFRDEPAAEAEVRTVLGKAYTTLGEAELAIEHLDRALRIDSLQPGTTSAELYEVLWPLALNTRGRDDVRVGFVLEQRMQAAGLDLLRATSPALAASLSGLDEDDARGVEEAIRIAEASLPPGSSLWAVFADLLRLGGGRSTSADLVVKAIDIYRRRAGLEETHTRVLDARWQRIEQLTETGQFREAEQAVRETLELVDAKGLPQRHWYRAVLQLFLGTSLMRQERLVDAEPALQAALVDLENSVGAGEHLANTALVRLVELSEAQGLDGASDAWRERLARSLTLKFRFAPLEQVKIALGPRHADAASALDLVQQTVKNLEGDDGLSAADDRRLSDALDLFRRLDPADPRTVAVASTLTGLSAYLAGRRGASRSVGAHELLQYHVEVLRQADVPPLVRATHHLSCAYTDSDEFEKGARLAEEVIATAKRFGLPHMVGIGQITRGRCLLRLSRHQEAERLLLDGYEQIAAALGEINLNSEWAFRELQKLYVETGAPTRGVPAALRRLDQLTRNGAEARTLAITAVLLAAIPDLDADVYAVAGRAAQDATLRGSDDPWCLAARGVVAYRTGRFETARDDLVAAVALHWDTHEAVALPLAFLAMAQHRLGATDAARQTWRRIGQVGDLSRYPIQAASVAECERVLGGN